MLAELTDVNKRAVFATGLVLVLANLLPMVFVGKMGWGLMDDSPDAKKVFVELASILLILYWAEIMVVGLFNLVRMILIAPAKATLGTHLWKLFFVPFFAAHFGFFCVGIGLAIQLIYGKDNFEIEEQIAAMINGSTEKLFWALFISHLFSFFWNFVVQREFRRTTVTRRMILPYIRVLPTTILTIAAAFIFQKVELPIWSLFVFIGVKTLIDLIVHCVMHFRLMSGVGR